MISPQGTIACFGEIVMRVSVPHGEMPLQSARFDAHAGGAEANVAVALATLGHQTAMISAVPEGPIGDGVLGELRRHGVDDAPVPVLRLHLLPACLGVLTACPLT